MKHTIEYQDFKNEKVDRVLASSAGKRLVVIVNLSNCAAHYKVIKNDVVDYETSILERAIDQYNELP